jgi:hypothetical protein
VRTVGVIFEQVLHRVGLILEKLSTPIRHVSGVDEPLQTGVKGYVAFDRFIPLVVVRSPMLRVQQVSTLMLDRLHLDLRA